MTTHTLTGITADNGDSGTGTAIRAWVQKVHDALIAIGLVQTADSGQAVISTLLNPASNVTAAGYEIWRFDDDLQSTNPIYFKLEYGRGNTASVPGLWVTVGKGSDGAGNITGTLIPRNSLVGANTATGAMSRSGTGTGYAMYDNCCLALVPFAEGFTGNGNPTLILERSRNDQGQPTGAGMTLVTGASNAALAAGATGAVASLCAVNYANPTSICWGAIPVVLPTSINGVALGASTSLAAGSIGPVFPWIAYVPGISPWQCLTAMTYAAGDAPSGIFQTHNLGLERSYLAIPLSVGMCGFSASPSFSTSGQATGQNTYAGLAILWE